MRFALVLAAAALMGCAGEPTAVDHPNERPAFTATGSSGGGISFAAGSGCTVVLSHFECSFTANGFGSYPVAVSQRALWTYTYQCVHRKTGRPSRQGPLPGSVGVVDLRTITGTDPLTITGTILAPVSPTDCAANKGAFTTTALLTNFIPNSWSLYAYKGDDSDNVYAELHEVL